ncbi:MAG TPA: glycerophosphodiester phosphodiesterase family protein [Blastocatellia bacterium]|nr:glycerophosphodiester phosphodiesterase family protein [Blastocatellia bacterium]
MICSLTVKTPSPDCRPLVIAHRGASGLAPENTLVAFRLAIALGADGIEMDVQLSADGHPVLMHDRRVNRTTDGAGLVSRLTLEQLQRLDAGSWFERRLMLRPRVRARLKQIVADIDHGPSSFVGEPLPELEEALSLLGPARLKRIYIELKVTRANRQALLGSVVSSVRAARLDHLVTLLSFDHAVVRHAKEIAPDLRTAAIFPPKWGRLLSIGSIISSAESNGADEVALPYGLATARTVEALHKHGFSVSVWTINRVRFMWRAKAAGADAIMTNYPNRLRQLVDSQVLRYGDAQKDDG